MKSVSGREGGEGMERERWYWRTKQKKMMKAEMADAFRIRRRVVGCLMGAAVVAGVFGWWILGWVVGILGAVMGSEGGGGENKLGRDW